MGTNVASDALANLASGGVLGGALIIVGEDYGEGSSIMQERSHAFAMKSQIWLLDPCPDLPSIVQAVKMGFELSKASHTPVITHQGDLSAGLSHYQKVRSVEVLKIQNAARNFIYQVAKGQGYSVIDGQRFDWQERDIFCVPSWALHEHVNTSQTEDACLFCFNDLSVIRALQLYYEEVLADNDGHQRVGG
ncbi:hypothetical protein BDD26_3382 [Xenorhabdus cabanillasii]|uniref:Cupin domain n=1 Tax=Xenorhabdus cabanillasii TaxID=351673 RepID=A0A3D9UUR0_9GAMM|nr:hypothetical protein BDD26_3382 [Xenorhabdus cabanillasii]